MQIAQINSEGEELSPVAAVTSGKQEDPMQQILQRMEKLEAGLKTVQQQRLQQHNGGGARCSGSPKKCWNCQGEGHYRANCPSAPRGPVKQQENETPSEP